MPRLLWKRAKPSIITLADRARDAGQWGAAAGFYREALRRNPRNSPIWVQYGHVLKESGHLAEAEKAYRKALAHDRRNVDTNVHLGHILKLQGHEKEARAAYLRGFVLDPSLNGVSFELARLGWSEAHFSELKAIAGVADDPPTTLGSQITAESPPIAGGEQPPEPSITPPPIKPVASGPVGAATIRAARFLREIPWRERPGASAKDKDAIAAQYRSFKIGMLHSSADDFANEIAAAISTLGSEEEHCLTIEELICALGISPQFHVEDPIPNTFPIPILQRYREKQVQATRRFRIDHGQIGTAAEGPTISLLLTVDRAHIIYLERAVLSVICQTYSDWELCIVDNFLNKEIDSILKYYEMADRRIKLGRTPANSDIALATNMALDMATGDYIGLLNDIDLLTRDALALVAAQLKNNSSIDLVYTDECKIDGDDIVDKLICKPDWSPLLLTARMYTGHFSVYRASLIRELGGFRSKFASACGYDLALRVAERNPTVAHLREPVYGSRTIGDSAAVVDELSKRNSEIAALQDAVDRRGWGGVAVALPAANRVLRTIDNKPLVSIVVPSDDVEHISQTINSIVCFTRYQRFEIVVVTKSSLVSECPSSDGSDRVRFVPYDKPFNFSDKCNFGAAAANGDYLIFFNDDVRVISPDWIDVVLEYLTLPGVGIVGPKLLYEDGRIQHAGMVTGTRRLLGTSFHVYPSRTSASFNLAQSVREVSLISAACLGISNALFLRIGGFDAVNVPIFHSDVDLCLRIRELGYSCIYTPHAELTHIGHVSIGGEVRKGRRFSSGKPDSFIMKRFGPYLEEDPFFPPAMRDLLYIDSQDEFHYHSGYRRSLAFRDGLVLHSNDRSDHDIRSGNSLRQSLDILILSHDLSLSGAPRAAYDVARVLRAAGHFVVVASPVDGPYRQRFLATGVDVIIDERLLKRDPWLGEFAASFDRVICNTIVCWPAIIQLSNAGRIYWYVHESKLIHNFVENIPEFSDALRAAQAIWADSALAAEALAKHGVPSRIIEYGTDDWRRLGAARNDSHGKVVIGVVGSYEPRKGQDLAIAGLLQVPTQLRTGAELRLFGRTLDARFREEIETLAGHDEPIRFLDEMEHDECLRQMAEMDIVLVTSRDDALSLVALDALSLGKTLVCSATTGASAYLQPGVSGLILAENTPDEIGQTLALAISDPQLRRRLGQGARQVYEQYFTLDIFAGKLKMALGLATIVTSDNSTRLPADNRH